MRTEKKTNQNLLQCWQGRDQVREEYLLIYPFSPITSRRGGEDVADSNNKNNLSINNKCFQLIYYIFSFFSGLESNIIKHQAGRAFTEMRKNFTSQNFSIQENPRWGRAAAAPAVKISHGFALYNRFFPCMEDNPNRTFLCMEATSPCAIKNQRKARNAPSRLVGALVRWAVFYGIRELA